jgi:hypothetical protein
MYTILARTAVRSARIKSVSLGHDEHRYARALTTRQRNTTGN